MHLQSLHIEAEITEEKESGLARRRFWYFYPTSVSNV